MITEYVIIRLKDPRHIRDQNVNIIEQFTINGNDSNSNSNSRTHKLTILHFK